MANSPKNDRIEILKFVHTAQQAKSRMHRLSADAITRWWFAAMAAVLFGVSLQKRKQN